MKRALYAIAVLLPLALHAAGFWSFVIREATHPYQLDYGEGIVLYQASKITDMTFAYKPIEEYPFVVFHYPPLYHLTVLAVASVTGSLLSAGRAVSVVSGGLTTVTIATMLYLSLPRRFDFWRRASAATCAGLLPSLLVVMTWTSLARVDMLAVFLSFVGLALFVLAGRRQIWEYVAFGFFVAAAFTKQTAIAAPVACLVTALIVDWKQAARLVTFAVGLGGILLGGLAWRTHGGVIRHLFLYNQNTFSLDRMIQGFGENLLLILPIAGLAVVHVAIVGFDVYTLPASRRWTRVHSWLRRNGIRRLSFVAALMLPVAALVAQSYGKTGSNFNYFIEWNLTCCLLAGLVVFRAWNARWCIPILWFLACVVPIVIVVQGLPFGMRSLWPPNPTTQALVASRSQAHATVLKVIERASGPVFSEDMLLLIEAGKDVPAEPAIIRELATSGMWDETKFTSLIRQRAFELIVVEDLSRRTRYTAAVVAAIDQSYSQTQQVGQYEIYEPRPRN
jgi:hypothetical protein